VHLRDYSENKGWASLPGPQYGYQIFYSRGSTRQINGNLSPLPDLAQNLFGFVGQGGPQLEEVTAEDIYRHVLLTATGRKVADMVISESPIVRRKDIAANYQSNVFSRAQAIPIIAHYLRTQQIYHLDPIGSRYGGNRKTFYHSAVWALAPNICYWEAKADYVIDSRYRTDSSEMVGRLIRALKAYDDLRFHLGALQTLDAYDEVADCVDRILWSLCGAVDVLARSLHFALQLPGQARYAKLHGSDWYTNKFRPTYANAAGITNVDQTQAAIDTVFKLRNTIHYRALAAAGASTEPAPYVGKEHGRVQLLLPNDVYSQLDTAERARWGFEEVAPGTATPAAADLATVATSALDTMFSFLDQLCGMISFEGIQDKDEVLKLNVFTVLRSDERVAPALRAMLGFTTTASSALGSAYQLDDYVSGLRG
jgi:hypothetical protein